jgi:hypothetical protein
MRSLDFGPLTFSSRQGLRYRHDDCRLRHIRVTDRHESEGQQMTAGDPR